MVWGADRMPLGSKVGAFIDLLLRGPGPAEPAFAPLGADEPEDALYGVEPLRILISPLAGDTTGLAARHIQDRLSGRMGVSIAIADRPLTVPGADYSQALFVSMAVDLGRRWLKRDGASTAFACAVWPAVTVTSFVTGSNPSSVTSTR